MKVLALLLTVLTAAASLGDTAAKRLDRFVEAFNSNDRAKGQAMVNAEFDPAMFKNRNSDAWTDQTLGIAKNLAPIKWAKKDFETPFTVVASIEGGKGEKLAIRIDCSPKEPNKIVGIEYDENGNKLRVNKKCYRGAGDEALKEEHGICKQRSCYRPVTTGKDGKPLKMCEECRKRFASYRDKGEGICKKSSCKAEARPGGKWCQYHVDKENQRSRYNK